MNTLFTARNLAIAGAVFVASLAITSAIVIAFLVLIKPDHFLEKPALSRRAGISTGRFALAVAKNLLGTVLVIVGLVLSVPGVPGQGLLTILVGLLLLDIPGKRKLELRLVSQSRVLRTINRLRRRFDRPPLRIEPADCDENERENERENDC